MIQLWRRRRDQFVEPRSENLRTVLGSARPPDAEIRCGGCRRRPHQIPEYLDAIPELNEPAKVEVLDRRRFRLVEDEPILRKVERLADEWIRRNEGTFNPETNRFLCSEDYVRAGMPTNADHSPWKCP